jgi:dipeptidyl aminopeptidase/acylaminoacyl peptidase
MRTSQWSIRAAAGLVLVASAASAASAQDNRVQRANWALAERFSEDRVRQVVFSTNVQPRFLGESDSLWYQWRDHKGSSFWLVVPQTRTKRPLFDHTKMAAQLSTLHKKPYDAFSLPFTNVTFTEDRRGFRFNLDSARYEWTLANETLRHIGRAQRDSTEGGGGGRRGGGGGGGFGGGQNQDFRNFSPDSTAFAFARDHNLFVVEVATRDTIQLTTDGVTNYSFGFRDTTQQQQQQQDDDQQDEQQRQEQQRRARDPRVRAQVTWSPDSRAFSVPRQDQRKVKDLYLVNVLANPRPTLVSYRYAMPGEDDVAQQELYTFRRGERQLAKLPVEKWKDQRYFNVHWPVASDRIRLVRRDRLQRNLELIEVALPSNDIKVLLTESVENANLEMGNGIRYVKAGSDFIWWSERTGWGHFYLYDHNGTLKRPLTSGEWRADGILSVDSVRRVLWFGGYGREPGENPYYRHTYRTALDGPATLTLLDPGETDHASTMSPTQRYFVDNSSRPDLPPKAVLRDATTGTVVQELAEMDVTRLKDLGWKPPERFVVKAADGVTDIYGNIFVPFDLDPAKKYPIIASVYPGPQTEQVNSTFSANAVQQRLAQLGFVVIQIGNRGGNPRRSNAYQHYSYYNLRDYGLADKKAGIEQLAARYPYIDIDRVGIYGHSGGGFMTAAAMLLPPYNDFFKVGVSSAGNHDNNVYNQNWSEQYHGLREVRTQRTTAAGISNDGQNGQEQQTETKFEIHIPTNAEIAQNLKGRILLVHGDMDNNVHPAGTIRLMDALIKANKRFDFMLMPGKAHGFADYQPYFTRMMFEYFSEHLLGDYYRADAIIR